jgi:hypothetical protein
MIHKIRRATAQNFAALGTWRPGFVHLSIALPHVCCARIIKCVHWQKLYFRHMQLCRRKIAARVCLSSWWRRMINHNQTAYMACILTSGKMVMTELVYKDCHSLHCKESKQLTLSVSTSRRNDTFLSGTVGYRNDNFLSGTVGYRNRCSVTFWGTVTEAPVILVTYSWVQGLDKEQFLPRKTYIYKTGNLRIT